MHHQLATAITADPMIGPAASATATRSAISPTLRPSRARGCVKRMSAVETPNIEAEANPCAVRARKRAGNDRDIAQMSEDRMKSQRPKPNTRR